MSGWLFLLQQTGCAWSILLALGLCAGLRRASARRLGLASAAAGVMTLFCQHPLGRLAALGVTVVWAPLLAWPGVPQALRSRMRLTCLALSVLMAGSAQLLHAFGLGRTPLVMALMTLLPLAARLLPRDSRMPCVTVEIIREGHRLALTALIDSGNLLRDPLTHLPVIVISRQAAARLLPLPAPDEVSPGMRLISVRTAAGSALMQLFRPQQVRLLLHSGWQDAPAMIGVSPDGYSGFQALVPSGVLSSAKGGISLCP